MIHKNSIEQNEILNYAIENGIINMSYVQEVIEMKKRNKILNAHQYKIWKGKNEKWYTYILDIENNKRKLIKRSSKEEIEDVIIKYYEGLSRKKEIITFRSMFEKWREVQKELVSSNTLNKYDCDYKRFFEGKDFEMLDIKHLTEETIKTFIVKTIKEQDLCKKTCKSLYGYINGTINSARINKIIQYNPMEFIQAKQFYKWCKEKPKTIDQRIISDNDMKKLIYRIHEDYDSKEDYIPVYAIELASYTGMRVGELSALRWDNITKEYIIINMSEKYDRIKKEYFIDKTKNGKDRIFPITEDIKALLAKLKKAEMKYGFLSEWVFSNERGRIHARTISDCMRNKCEQAGIPIKSIHALRRTLNSKMRCMGVSSTVASSLLGHTEEVNELNYTYDITGITEKKDIIENINKKLKIV